MYENLKQVNGWYPYQLADDEKSYGAQAAHWILVDKSADNEHPKQTIFPTREEALRFAAAETPPVSRGSTSQQIVDNLTPDEARSYLAAVLDVLYTVHDNDTKGYIDLDKEWDGETLGEIAFKLEALVQ